MQSVSLLPVSLLAAIGSVVATPTFAADLDDLAYSQRDVVIERPAPRVVERERIIERHYYYEPRGRIDETHVAPRTYAPSAYAVPVYAYGDGCGWLRRRAEVSDNPYWWHRYRACRD
jgi:hypothetical protein